MRWAIEVVWSDGTKEQLKRGVSGGIAYFSARSRADEQAEFMRLGMDDDPDVQSVNVVLAPKKSKPSTAPDERGET